MATAAAAPKTQWAREYETIYILRPNVDNETAEKVVGRARNVVKRLGGTLTKIDNWGKRRLAYPIEKNRRGIFVYLKYVGFGDLVAELERNLRLLDEVVRFQTVLLREDIDPATVEVDPEEVQYLHVEDEDEPEDAETERARSLGMIPRTPRPERPAESARAPAAEAAPGVAAAAGAGTEPAAESGTAAAAAPAAAAESVAEPVPASVPVPESESAPESVPAAVPDAEAAADAAAEASDDDDAKPEGGA
ncbi:MAG: 30S ribosomal protein S6 [Myxococcales bacterium]|nr:30S ribosomal protein S6 [Myxococcales bacterium]MDH3844257.1 30S ribosomal protein S6 [Myxococcales bacterium]